MTLLRHSIEIDADMDEVFAICLDVERWPLYFSSCLKVRILERDKSRQVIEIVTKTNNTEMISVSERIIDRDSFTIHFRQVNSSALLKNMQGAWRLYPTGSKVLLSLEHEFDIKDDVAGIVPDVKTKEDAHNFMKKSIHDNTRRDLAAIQQIAEHPDESLHKELTQFSDVMVIQRPLGEVFRLLQHAEKWPAFLPHCQNFDLLYDDGVYQEFTMDVNYSDGSETVRTIRECTGPYSIQYFLPEPARILRMHHGNWFLEHVGKHTLVTAHHFIHINMLHAKEIWGEIDCGEALDRVKATISSDSLKIMEAIIKYDSMR